MITKQEIEELFEGLLSQITDQSLRELTVETWLKGCERGNWRSVDDLDRIPFTLLVDAGGIGLISHTVAVTRGARDLARAQVETCHDLPYDIDMNRIIVGGLLHDVGKLLEIQADGEGGYRKSRNGKCTRHPISGAILAAEAGLPDEIVNIIACHSREGDGRPQTVETVLVHQADFAVFNPLAMREKGLLI